MEYLEIKAEKIIYLIMWEAEVKQFVLFDNKYHYIIWYIILFEINLLSVILQVVSWEKISGKDRWCTGWYIIIQRSFH